MADVLRTAWVWHLLDYVAHCTLVRSGRQRERTRSYCSHRLDLWLVVSSWQTQDTHGFSHSHVLVLFSVNHISVTVV